MTIKFSSTLSIALDKHTHTHTALMSFFCTSSFLFLPLSFIPASQLPWQSQELQSFLQNTSRITIFHHFQFTCVHFLCVKRQQKEYSWMWKRRHLHQNIYIHEHMRTDTHTRWRLFHPLVHFSNAFLSLIVSLLQCMIKKICMKILRKKNLEVGVSGLMRILQKILRKRKFQKNWKVFNILVSETLWKF